MVQEMDGLKKIIIILAIAAVVGLCFAMPAFSQAMGQKDLMRTMIALGNYKNITAAANVTNWNTNLYAGGPYTVFAPTDDAFGKLSASSYKELMGNKGELTAIMNSLTISGSYTADQLAKMGTVNTLGHSRLTFSRANNGSVMVNGARIVQPDVKTNNGIVQGIDTVLVPKT